MNKYRAIFLNILPVFVMVALIALIRNDYLLTAIYVAIIAMLLWVKRYLKDILVLAFGFVIMIVSEYFFIKTGVETFQRRSLFGIMPLWLPFLWGYGFVVIKRVVNLL